MGAVLAAIALIPSAPVLVPELAGAAASEVAELRAADFVARLIEEGALTGKGYRRELLHRIGGDGELEAFGAETKYDVNWTFLKTLRDLGPVPSDIALRILAQACAGLAKAQIDPSFTDGGKTYDTAAYMAAFAAWVAKLAPGHA